MTESKKTCPDCGNDMEDMQQMEQMDRILIKAWKEASEKGIHPKLMCYTAMTFWIDMALDCSPDKEEALSTIALSMRAAFEYNDKYEFNFKKFEVNEVVH